MNALATQAKGIGYELLGSGPLERFEEAARQVRHGNRLDLILTPKQGAAYDPYTLARVVDDAVTALGFTPPDGENVSTYVDPYGGVHVRLQERSPDIGILAPVLLVGLMGVPLLFFLFKEEKPATTTEENKWKKFLPFLLLGGLVLGGLALTAFAASRKG